MFLPKVLGIGGEEPEDELVGKFGRGWIAKDGDGVWGDDGEAWGIEVGDAVIGDGVGLEAAIEVDAEACGGFACGDIDGDFGGGGGEVAGIGEESAEGGGALVKVETAENGVVSDGDGAGVGGIGQGKPGLV